MSEMTQSLVLIQSGVDRLLIQFGQLLISIELPSSHSHLIYRFHGFRASLIHVKLRLRVADTISSQLHYTLQIVELDLYFAQLNHGRGNTMEIDPSVALRSRFEGSERGFNLIGLACALVRRRSRLARRETSNSGRRGGRSGRRGSFRDVEGGKTHCKANGGVRFRKQALRAPYITQMLQLQLLLLAYKRVVIHMTHAFCNDATKRGNQRLT